MTKPPTKSELIHYKIQAAMRENVTERGDGSFDIDWDPNDPVESIMNEWTEEDFIQALKDHLETVKKNA
jgi:hypothetical protein